MSRTRSVKINIFANYIGQAYATFIGIVVFPLYLQYLGAEAYGLVGFFVVMNTVLCILDVGMSPMLNREIAAARADEQKRARFRTLLRSVEILFIAFSLAVVSVMYALSGWISTHWLNVEALDLHEVAQCVKLMSIMFGLRFFSAIYRSGLGGVEAQVSMNSASITIATLKAVGALAILRWVSTAPLDFFLYQFIIACLEPALLGFLFYRQLPDTPRPGLVFSWKVLRPALPFAMGVAYTASIWIFITQLDKLLLSGILPLSEYGYFAIVASISSGVVQLSGPIANAVLPRMTYLLSGSDEPGMRTLYRKASQVVAAIILPITLTIAYYGTELIYAWTGNHTAADWGGPILFWYMMGNAFLALMSFQYYLQFAHGNLKLYVKMNTYLLLFASPLIVFAAYQYGALGTSVSWFIIQLSCFLVWPFVIHRKFAPGLHKAWLSKDLFPVALGTVLGILLATRFPEDALSNMSRPVLFMTLIGLGLVVLACASAGSSYLRGYAFSTIKKVKGILA
ncbi:MAG: oligosaccharide flippase family protein [Bdellovibrionales bacterium]